jgi:flagellar basal body-associated protein FliL
MWFFSTNRKAEMKMTAKLWIMLIKVVVVVLMVAAIVIMAICLKRQGAEKRRLKENYDIELSKDHSQQQTVDVQELKDYFSKEVATLKEHGIKPRDVENIIEVTYYVRDTTIYRDTLVYIYDTIRNAHRACFCVETDCFNIDGQIVGDTLEIRDIKSYDDILVALYKEKPKCLFGKRRVKAIAISGCTGDTLAIKRNLIIEK